MTVKDDKNQLASSLLEELIIARGLISEICTERNIPMPMASLTRMEKAISEAEIELSK